MKKKWTYYILHFDLFKGNKQYLAKMEEIQEQSSIFQDTDGGASRLGAVQNNSSSETARKLTTTIMGKVPQIKFN